MRPLIAIILALLPSSFAFAQASTPAPESAAQIKESIQKFEAQMDKSEGESLINIYSEIALGYTKLGRIAPAIEALEHARDVARSYPQRLTLTQFTLTTLLDATGKQDRAIIEFKDILSREPNNLIAMAVLARDLADMDRELDSALDYALRAVKASPKTPSFADSLGWVYFKRGQIDEAISELSRANVQNPGNWPSLRGHLATALRRKLGPSEREKKLIGLLEAEYSKDGEIEIRNLLQAQ